MRVFVVLASLVVLISADVKHLYDAPYGSTTTTQHVVKPAVVTTAQYVNPAVHTSVKYNEQSVVSTPSVGFISTTGSHGSGSGFGSGSSSGFGSSHGSGFGSGHGVSTGFGSGSSASGFGGSFQDSSSSNYNVNYKTTLVKQTAPLVSKSTYVFAAPEDKENIQREQTIVLPRPRQHYKVVFIKAPATTIVNTPSAAVGGQTQEKTLIYVLSDKKRIENHIDVPEFEQGKLQKPEVFFIQNNQPSQVVNSKIQYETVNTVSGAENGAINGIPNKVTGGAGQFQDEASNPEQAQIAQAIYQAVQTGGVQGGVQTVDQLISAGHSIGHNAGSSFGNSGQYDTTYTSGGAGEQTYYTGAVQPTTGFTQEKTYYTGAVQPTTGFTQEKTYYTGAVQPVVSQTTTTTNVGSEGYNY